MDRLNFSQLWRYDDVLLHGIFVTLVLTLVATVAGLLIGALCASAAQSRFAPLRVLVRAYVEIIRNTPTLIQIFLIFFVLPFAGLRLAPVYAAATALSIYFGAHATEILRSGLTSIPRSQLEAGQGLGLTRWEVFRHIVLPPALRNVFPSLTSQVVLLFLGTSLASQVSAEELFHAAGFIESRTYRSFEVYSLTCGIYLALVLLMKGAFLAAERLAFRWPTGR